MKFKPSLNIPMPTRHSQMTRKKLYLAGPPPSPRIMPLDRKILRSSHNHLSEPMQAFVTPQTPMVRSTKASSSRRGSFSGSASVCSMHEISMLSSDDSSQSGKSLPVSPPRTLDRNTVEIAYQPVLPKTPPRPVRPPRRSSSFSSLSPSSTLTSSPPLITAPLKGRSRLNHRRITCSEGPPTSSQQDSLPPIPSYPVDVINTHLSPVQRNFDDEEDWRCCKCQANREAVERHKEENLRLQNLVQELVGLIAKQQGEIESLKGKFS